LGSRSPVAYTIKGEGLRLDIALVETDELLLHEEIIPASLEILRQQIEKDGFLKSPVIVDKRSYVVLDGMHRVTALKSLSCLFTCVCFVDYRNPRIELERWCRVVDRPIDILELKEKFKELRVVESLPSYSEKNSSILLMFGKKKYLVLPPKNGILPASNVVADLETWFREKGLGVRYETEQDAIRMLKDGNAEFILFPTIIRKQDVLETAKAGKVLTFKSTRHVVPARPLKVNVPIELLREKGINIEEANIRLSEMLSRRPLRRISAGHVWEGRRYEEVLYVFEDD
jgi:hypothetical protein